MQKCKYSKNLNILIKGNFTQIRQHTRELLSSNSLEEVGSIFRETTIRAMDDDEIWGILTNAVIN